MTEVEKLQEKIDQMERDRVRLLEEEVRDFKNRKGDRETPEERSERKRNESIAGWFFFALILIIIFA